MPGGNFDEPTVSEASPRGLRKYGEKSSGVPVYDVALDRLHELMYEKQSGSEGDSEIFHPEGYETAVRQAQQLMRSLMEDSSKHTTRVSALIIQELIADVGINSKHYDATSAYRPNWSSFVETIPGQYNALRQDIEAALSVNFPDGSKAMEKTANLTSLEGTSWGSARPIIEE